MSDQEVKNPFHVIEYSARNNGTMYGRKWGSDSAEKIANSQWPEIEKTLLIRQINGFDNYHCALSPTLLTELKDHYIRLFIFYAKVAVKKLKICKIFFNIIFKISGLVHSYKFNVRKVEVVSFQKIF